MNVIILAIQDSSCLGAQYAKSLRSVGVNAKMFIRKKHPFDYPGQGTLYKNYSEIESYIKKADVVHLMHSQDVIPGANLKDKKVIIHYDERKADVRQHKSDQTVANGLLTNDKFTPIYKGLETTIRWYMKKYKLEAETK